MSHDDELAFARYLKEGDKALEEAYQDQGDEQPSAELDATILAAAKAQAQMQAEKNQTRAAKRPVRRNWGAPVAVAATVVLAIGLVNLIPKEQRISTPTTMSESDTLVPLQRLAPMGDAKQDRAEMPRKSFAAPAKAKRKLEQSSSKSMPVAPEPMAEPAAAFRSLEQPKKSNAPIAPMRSDIPATAPVMQSPAESGMMMDEMQSRQRLQKMESRKAMFEQRAKPAVSDDRAVWIMAEEEAAVATPELKGRVLGASAAKDADAPDPLLEEIYALLASGRKQEAEEKLQQYIQLYPKRTIPDDLKPLLIGD